MELVDIQDLKTVFFGLWLPAAFSKKSSKNRMLGPTVQGGLARCFLAQEPTRSHGMLEERAFAVGCRYTGGQCGRGGIGRRNGLRRTV